jgi:hypothetical protein
VFDTFTLASNATLGAVLFDVQTDYPTGAPPWGPLNVGIFTTSGGLPDLSGQILNYTANFGVGPTNYQFSNTANDTSIVTFPSSGTPLTGGTQYWISFYNPSNLGVPGYFGGLDEMVQLRTSTFVPLGQSAGFELLSFGTVPEPATWAMRLIGFAGLGFAAYRKARLAVSVA